MKNNYIKKGIIGLCLASMTAMSAEASTLIKLENNTVLSQDNTAIKKDDPYKSNRPAVDKRLFQSKAVESEIVRIKKMLKNQKLAWVLAIYPFIFTIICFFSLLRRGAASKLYNEVHNSQN